MEERTKAKEEKFSVASSVGALRPGIAVFHVEEGIQLQALQDILKRVVNLHGCTSCGLAGLDLYFRVPDPLLNEKFRDIGGLRNVEIIR